MKQKSKPHQLSVMLAYILERRPDEFGLIPDENGYVRIKDLLKALNEEDGWGYVRESHIHEVFLSVSEKLFEISENLIRAKNRDQLPKRSPADQLPKLLYTCIRKRAHPHVIEKGISPAGRHHVVLSSDISMAERIGKRIDPSPVTLIVQVQKAVSEGVAFIQAGEVLFLAEFIPPDCFTGPPLPKQKPDIKKTPVPEVPAVEPHPGSFFADPEAMQARKKEKLRDKKKKQMDRDKEKRWKKDQKRKIWEDSE